MTKSNNKGENIVYTEPVSYFPKEIRKACKLGEFAEGRELRALKGVMLGHAVGDALGVPVEFVGRKTLDEFPVDEMIGYGAHPVPAGSWSDDTSMALATLDSLKRGRVDFEEIMSNFERWMTVGEYTPTGVMFDIGGACRTAIRNHMQGKNALACGLDTEYSNGNGSLMRIHPFVLYAHCKGLSLDECLKLVDLGSSLTHAHPRSKLGCRIYAVLMYRLLDGGGVGSIRAGLAEAKMRFEKEAESVHYDRIFDKNFASLTREKIKSSGYIVDTLEAALWCVLTTKDYKSCVLRAVNLGEDTDSVTAIAGGIAGILYGYESIPKEWLSTLLRREYIEKLCESASKKWLKLN